jgi:hypothetical protein
MSKIIDNTNTNTKTITITRNKYSSFEDELQYVRNHMLENKINGYIVSLKDNSYTIKITNEPQLPSQYSTLLSLDLKWSNIDTLKLCELLELCLNLRNLNLAGLFIGKEGMEILAPVIGKLTKLTHLNLANNHIYCDGARLLVKALKNCPDLKRLNLRKNDLESYGAEAIGELFNICTKLTSLDICQNFLCNEGTEDIAKALLKCECETLSLRKLILILNYIGSRGAIKLTEVVEMFPQLTIDVNNNHIGKDEYESDLNHMGKDALVSLGSILSSQWEEEDEVYSADEVSVPSERDYGFDNDSDYNLDLDLDYNDPNY